jgi:hypothetical protein
MVNFPRNGLEGIEKLKCENFVGSLCQVHEVSACMVQGGLNCCVDLCENLALKLLNAFL